MIRSSTASTVTNRISAKEYVQGCFSKAVASTGVGYVSIQAKTTDGTVWLGSGGTEDDAWAVAATRLDQDGCGHFAVPSWNRMGALLAERSRLRSQEAL